MSIINDFVVFKVSEYLDSYTAHQILPLICKTTYRHMRKIPIHLKDSDIVWTTNQIHQMMKPKINKLLTNPIRVLVEGDSYMSRLCNINNVHIKHLIITTTCGVFDVIIGVPESVTTIVFEESIESINRQVIEKYINLESLHLNSIKMDSLDCIKHIPITKLIINMQYITQELIINAVYYLGKNNLTDLKVEYVRGATDKLKKYINKTYPHIHLSMFNIVTIATAINFICISDGARRFHYYS
jgi:hypothetical protein